MSDQQQENEITTTQAAPAVPVASDQVAAPAQASAPETPKAASTPMPVAAEKAVLATGEEAAPAKPKRTRRTAKPAADGEEVTKPKRRTTRTTRAKLTVAADSSAPISDEVAQARALAQISEAQVVRARRRAAEREAAALTELAAPSVPETPAATETPVADQPTEKPVPRTRRRTAAKAEQVAEQVTPELAEASVRSAAGEGTSPVEPAAPVEASEVPVVDPALRRHRRRSQAQGLYRGREGRSRSRRRSGCCGDRQVLNCCRCTRPGCYDFQGRFCRCRARRRPSRSQPSHCC